MSNFNKFTTLIFCSIFFHLRIHAQEPDICHPHELEKDEAELIKQEMSSKEKARLKKLAEAVNYRPSKKDESLSLERKKQLLSAVKMVVQTAFDEIMQEKQENAILSLRTLEIVARLGALQKDLECIDVRLRREKKLNEHAWKCFTSFSEWQQGKTTPENLEIVLDHYKEFTELLVTLKERGLR